MDIPAVGWILLAAGALGILLDVIVFAPRRRGAGTAPVVEERRVYEQDPPRY
ncbi:MAG: hypothetical protein ACT4PP_11220 [Sporichthyaceae bacterium]